ncbi:MAG: ATP synthase F1 subunit epsilon [Symbiobacteriaceae bacterium]|nr:ATP synthase F1 subunit epsilon [Symbiobacteriaceae bacterium]
MDSETAGKIHLRVYTPQQLKVDENVDMVILQSSQGPTGILPGHMPLSLMLQYGVARIVHNNEERRLAIYGGLAQIQSNQLLVITSEAEWPEEIDLSLAESQRAEAESSLRLQTDSVEVQRTQVALRRSLVQIEVCSYPIVNRPPK